MVFGIVLTIIGVFLLVFGIIKYMTMKPVERRMIYAFPPASVSSGIILSILGCLIIALCLRG